MILNGRVWGPAACSLRAPRCHLSCLASETTGRQGATGSWLTVRRPTSRPLHALRSVRKDRAWVWLAVGGCGESVLTLRSLHNPVLSILKPGVFLCNPPSPPLCAVLLPFLPFSFTSVFFFYHLSLTLHFHPLTLAFFFPSFNSWVHTYCLPFIGITSLLPFH